jgi:hypothetical protein
MSLSKDEVIGLISNFNDKEFHDRTPESKLYIAELVVELLRNESTFIEVTRQLIQQKGVSLAGWYFTADDFKEIGKIMKEIK